MKTISNGRTQKSEKAKQFFALQIANL